MTTTDGHGGDEPSREILQDRTRAWWASVLAGHIEGAHPIQGTNLSAAMDGDTLVLTGAVPSNADRKEVEREVAPLRGSGFTRIENKLAIASTSDDSAGLLTQTLVAAFETADRAAFAERYLAEHAHIHPLARAILDPATGEAARAQVRAWLPEPSWADACAALEAGRTLLVVSVDETEAFIAREVLDEETRSIETVVLPPEAAAGWQAVEEAAADAASAQPGLRPARKNGGAA